MTMTFFQTRSNVDLLRRFCGVLAGPTLVVCSFASPALAQSALPQEAAAYGEQKVTASDGATNSYFGSAASHGALASIGADGENSFEGAADVFNSVGGVWTEGQKLTPSDGMAGDEFGYRTALRDDTAVVTAFSATVNGIVAQGAAYVFTSVCRRLERESGAPAGDGGLFDRLRRFNRLSDNIIAYRRERRDRGAKSRSGCCRCFHEVGQQLDRRAKTGDR